MAWFLVVKVILKGVVEIPTSCHLKMNFAHAGKYTLFFTMTCNYLYLFFQFGNTCYSNSVLQALYFCKPFREKVLEYKARNKRTKETLLTCLADLFYSIATQKKKVGSIAPKKFIARLRKEKGWYS